MSNSVAKEPEWSPYPEGRHETRLVPTDMPRVNGISFRCECGCNVFRNPVGQPLVYVCNACQTRYRGEK